MRTVFDSRMVCHIWANQSQSQARNSGNSVFFDGDTIYSYGRHFGMARIVSRKGHRAVLHTTSRYSITTSKHQSFVRWASRHLPSFTVPSIDGDHRENLAYFDASIREAALSATRARSAKEWKLKHLEWFVQQANAYAEFFGLRKRFKVPNDIDLEKLRRDAVEQQRRERERQAERERQREVQLQAAREAAMVTVEKWKAGEDVRVPWVFNEVFLRVANDEVQTSKGAQVPLAHAVRLLPHIRSGQAYAHNGHSIHVGHFRVDRIDENGNLWAGCHYITRAEMERLASQLGL